MPVKSPYCRSLSSEIGVKETQAWKAVTTVLIINNKEDRVIDLVSPVSYLYINFIFFIFTSRL